MPYSAVAFPSGQQADARQPTPADGLTPASQRPLMKRPTPADDEARGEAMLASSGCGSGGRVTRLAAAAGAEWFPRPPWRLPYSAVGFPRGGWSGIQPWFCTSVSRPACGQGYSPRFAPLLAGQHAVRDTALDLHLCWHWSAKRKKGDIDMAQGNITQQTPSTCDISNMRVTSRYRCYQDRLLL